MPLLRRPLLQAHRQRRSRKRNVAALQMPSARHVLLPPPRWLPPLFLRQFLLRPRPLRQHLRPSLRQHLCPSLRQLRFQPQFHPRPPCLCLLPVQKAVLRPASRPLPPKRRYSKRRPSSLSNLSSPCRCGS